ncbi:endonuclease NucS domain-containing protein [Paenibacillus elgii]|uniref:endonuclease NucS domain-containing protein n=1 Tax=Paenibacillus elgii TaxID=189691 RepID=UPI0006832139|nr:endonuclease NucS domain-containing protein [Paenibacillus elgii]
MNGFNGGERVNKIHILCHYYNKISKGEIIIFSYENDFEDYIIENIGIIEEGMKFVSNQVRIRSRRLDLLTIDSSGRLCGIELKNKKPNHGVINQCKYYLQNCEPLERLIVLSPTYTQKVVRQLLHIPKVELMQYHFEDDNIFVKDYTYKESKENEYKIVKRKNDKREKADINKFGLELRKIRMSLGLTVRDLQNLSGVSHSYITQIENGKRNTPTPDIIRELAEALRVPYNDLLILSGYLDA